MEEGKLNCVVGDGLPFRVELYQEIKFCEVASEHCASHSWVP
jgi:hypothetical protein